VANPAFSGSAPRSLTKTDVFTVQGAAFKTLVLLAIMACTFSYTWIKTTAGYSAAFKDAHIQAEKTPADENGKKPLVQIDLPPNVIGLAIGGCLGAFVIALITIFYQRSAPITAPIYAALEGLALGAISAGFETQYPGIVMEAMAGVVGTAGVMGVLYTSGILRPTQGFMVGLLSAMGGILLLYFTDIIMQAFGCAPVEIVHGNSWLSIGISVVIVIVAALNFIVDFGIITDAAENKSPRWYEWYAAFGLMLTIVWLYLEILKLLAKLRSSDD
jgi:uncharacterized YccA/Bax inhibitor family protein